MKRLLVIFVLGFFAQGLIGQEILLEADSTSKDYSSELPRIAPLEPTEALATFRIADGFRIELAAQEPQITDPISMAFDAHGRLFVVCMNGYSEDSNANLGMVRRLEDQDNDGRFDQGTDFVKGLSWPTAVACYDGGIFVAAPPNLLYCKDTNNDGVADEQRIVATGFSRSNVQGMFNSFRWGLDNRLHAACGLNGANITIANDDKVLKIRGRDVSIDPTTLSFRPESGGAQHGATFDRWGERFVCSNSDHLQWVEFRDRHLQRNPLLTGYRSRRSIAVEGPAAEVFRTSDVEPWRIVRTRLRVKGMVGGPVEGGGRAAGYFTSASGITAYNGDAFPSAYQKDEYLFVGDVGSNLVHLKRIETNGLEKIAKRATPPQTEFLTSTDNWFRPVQFANGPDGSIYVLDMYREVIEHPLSLPPMIKKHLDLTSGRTRGRIYRIAPIDWEPTPRPLPGAVNNSELVAMLGHANGWHRETAARMIVARSGKSQESAEEFAALLQETCSSESPFARIRALSCLLSIDRLNEPTLAASLRDTHPQVRRHGLRLIEQFRNVGTSSISQVESLILDKDICVQYQAALTLGRFPASVRRDPLSAIAADSSHHSKMRFAVLSSMGDDQLEMLRSVLSRGDHLTAAPLLEEIALQIGRKNRDEASTEIRDAFSLATSQANPLRFRLIASLLTGSGRQGKAVRQWLVNSQVTNANGLVEQLLRTAEQQIRDTRLSVQQRMFAIRTLRLGRFEQIQPILRDLMLPTQAAIIRDAAVEELGTFSSMPAAQTLLDAAASLPPTGRRRAYDLMTSRTTWSELLLESIRTNKTSFNQITASQRDRLLRHKNRTIAKRARELLGADSDRAQIVKQYHVLLSHNGDVTRGKALFGRVCSSCHRLDDVGTNVGPDLTPVRNRGASYLLTNILNPNGEVDSRYVAYTLTTSDGRVISGLLLRDTEAFLELRQADNSIVSLEKDQIESLTATGRSLMPEGLERDLGQQGIADVIAYLLQSDH